MVEHVVSATEARIRFGELMRRAVEHRQPIIVERGGAPQVVVLAVAEYERLKATQTQEAWREALARALRVGARIQARRGGQPLPPPQDVIQQMRAARDGEFMALR